MKFFNHIIVGTGQATGTLLAKLIPTGESIAVIEGNKIGFNNWLKFITPLFLVLLITTMIMLTISVY